MRTSGGVTMLRHGTERMSLLVLVPALLVAPVLVSGPSAATALGAALVAVALSVTLAHRLVPSPTPSCVLAGRVQARRSRSVLRRSSAPQSPGCPRRPRAPGA